MTRQIFMRRIVLIVFGASIVPAAWTQGSQPLPAELVDANSGLYMKVPLSKKVKMSKLHPGDVVEGSLGADVYSSDRKLLSLGDHVRLTVEHLEQRRRTPNDHWPGVIQLFTPRHEKYPVFGDVAVTEAGKEYRFQAALVAERRLREVYAKAKAAKSRQSGQENGAVTMTAPSNGKPSAIPTIVLEAHERSTPGPDDKDESPYTGTNSHDHQVLPLGTRFKVVLLGNVSASKSKPGDVVQARVLEPVLLNAEVAIPAGSLLEGKVVKNTPPRWLSRGGALYLTFNNLILPSGNRLMVVASLAGAELDQRSHTRMDAEGRLQGEHPGKAWMAINLGVTAGVGKVADDTIQLIIETIVSTATDVSTAGSGRIVAGCASALYLATRKGRDVVLPRFTEMNVSLDRPVSLDTSLSGTPSSAPHKSSSSARKQESLLRDSISLE